MRTNFADIDYPRLTSSPTRRGCTADGWALPSRSERLVSRFGADHLPVEWAFALASVVSVGLVVAYLRLVVGSRGAFVEAGLAKRIYPIGLAAAHFPDGLTGRTITVLGVLTPFALMQLTGRIECGEAVRCKTTTA